MEALFFLWFLAGRRSRMMMALGRAEGLRGLDGEDKTAAVDDSGDLLAPAMRGLLAARAGDEI